jgi:AcrR family transcriptional regulator
VNVHHEDHGDLHDCGDGTPGLRERKKRATRQALAAAAMRLALEQGFENLRVEDIAEAAGVSPRTFNNYFSSREQAVCAARVAQTERISEALLARPADEPLLDALINAALAAHGEPSRALTRLVHSTPSLSGEFMRTIAEAQAPMVAAVAARTGTAPDDLLPQVATATLFGAMRVAMFRWQGSEESMPYLDLLRDALNQLRALTAPAEAAAAGTAPGAVSAVSPASARPAIIGSRVA